MYFKLYANLMLAGRKLNAREILVQIEDRTLNRNKSRLLFSSAEMFKKPPWQTV